jgi:hypothetical protein
MSRQRELPPILPAGHRSTHDHSNLPGSDPLERQGSFPVPGPIRRVKPVGTPWGDVGGLSRRRGSARPRIPSELQMSVRRERAVENTPVAALRPLTAHQQRRGKYRGLLYF